VEDALHINAAALTRHVVHVERDFHETPMIHTEKHKVLQILVNLIRNAKYALDDAKRTDKIMTVKVGVNADNLIKIEVIDNGVGIPPENLTRIFGHGFTTRRNGHGFGLHSSALAIKELGGSLQADSEGIGKGARFTLLLPQNTPQGQEKATA
jgi:two-component system NtrC family sensor kinase